MVLKAKPVTEKIYLELKEKISNLKSKNITPTLAAILIGEDPASLSYVKVKNQVAQDLGINFKLFHFPGFSGDRDVLKLIDNLNVDKLVYGIIVQLPLPEKFDTERIIKKISPEKDVDGLGSEKYIPPTAKAILEIMEYYHVDYQAKDKKLVIIGLGALVGKPLAKILNKMGIYPIVCTSTTGNLAQETLNADIIVSATGHPGLVTSEMVSPKATVIDAGTAESRGKIAGDVDKSVYEKVANYSPVPGGVGPVTVACLMRNVVLAAETALQEKS